MQQRTEICVSAGTIKLLKKKSRHYKITQEEIKACLRPQVIYVLLKQCVCFDLCFSSISGKKLIERHWRDEWKKRIYTIQSTHINDFLCRFFNSVGLRTLLRAIFCIARLAH